MRRHFTFREHFRLGNAPFHPVAALQVVLTQHWCRHIWTAVLRLRDLSWAAICCTLSEFRHWLGNGVAGRSGHSKIQRTALQFSDGSAVRGGQK